MQWYYPASGLFNAIVGMSCCLYVLLLNKKKLLNITFSLFSFFFSFWSLGYFFWQISDNAASALFWSRVLMFGAIFIPPTFLHYVLSLIDLTKEKKNALIIAYGINIFFAMSDFTPYFVASVEPRLCFKFWPTPGFLYLPFLLIFMWYVGYSHYLIIKHYKNFSGITQNQVKYVFLGTLLGFAGGTSNYPLWYNIPILPIGNALASLYVIANAFSIKNYLVEFKVGFTRGALFGIIYFLILAIPITTAFYGQSYFERALGHQWWILFFIIVGTLAYLGQVAYRYLRDKADDIFLGKQRAYQEYITTMAQSIVLYRDKHEVAQAIRDMLIPTMEVDRVLLFYLDTKAKEFISLEGKGEKQIHISWVHHSTTILLERWKEPIMNEEIARSGVKRHMEVDDTEALLKQADAVMFVPCIAGEEVVGFISVGQKKDKTIFTMDDIRVLKLLASEAALALKNVEFYQEMRDNELRLIQSAKLTSLGEMAAGFAHQINNPLQALVSAEEYLKGRIIKYHASLEQQGCSEETHKEITRWVNSDLETIDSMSFRIKNIIDSIRRFTKKTDFTQEEVNTLVKGGLEMIPERKKKLAHMTIVQDIPDTIPRVYVKAIDIEQVIMNLCTNAMEAMEEQGEGTITIQAREASEEGYVAITIADTGCGIPAEILERIFDPFFTTKGAQGTGLGLSVVHTIIKDNQGHITCTSKPRKGTTFTIVLPITKKQIQGGAQ